MMKKLLILCLVLAFSSVAMAGTITLKVADDDAKDHYAPSDTITIEMVADGYGLDDPFDNIAVVTIDNILSNNGGSASGQTLLEALTEGTGADEGTAGTGNTLLYTIRGAFP